jgi:hypothetical protein
MYCPQCGQERISEQTNFCSRCGFLLTGVSQVLRTGGELPGGSLTTPSNRTSLRIQGLKQGLFIFLLTFLVVPIVAIISVSFNLEPWAVAISAIGLFVGGILRMVYALMFESSDSLVIPNGGQTPAVSRLAVPTAAQNALPPQQTFPASVYVAPAPGRWRETNDLQPTSVTESTTQLLEKENEAQ